VTKGDILMKIGFHEINSVNDEFLKYAVIITRYNENWIFVRHKDRQTWEIPGGRRELNEDIIKTMKRELFEETGAVEFSIEPVCIYSVESEHEKSYGLLCYSEVEKFGEKLDYEIAERQEFKNIPNELTYPKIQPKLFYEVLKVKNLNYNFEEL
jgi:8-oxo-dGTP diphosphatase